jgi:hypothetical protein
MAELAIYEGTFHEHKNNARQWRDGMWHGPECERVLPSPAPSEDMVEKLSESSWNASAPGAWRFIQDYRKDNHRAHVRAVLSELANMGAEAHDMIANTIDAQCGNDALAKNAARIIMDSVRKFYAPILAAKDAELARRAAEIERLKASAIQSNNPVEIELDNAAKAAAKVLESDHVHELGSCSFCDSDSRRKEKAKKAAVK